MCLLLLLLLFILFMASAVECITYFVVVVVVFCLALHFILAAIANWRAREKKNKNKLQIEVASCSCLHSDWKLFSLKNVMQTKRATKAAAGWQGIGSRMRCIFVVSLCGLVGLLRCSFVARHLALWSCVVIRHAMRERQQIKSNIRRLVGAFYFVVLCSQACGWQSVS